MSLKINLKGWKRHATGVASIMNNATGAATTVPLATIAEVAWIKPLHLGSHGYEMGIKFLDVYEDDYKALVKHLDKMVDCQGIRKDPT